MKLLPKGHPATKGACLAYTICPLATKTFKQGVHMGT